MKAVIPVLRSLSIPAMLFLGACCCGGKDVVKVSAPTSFPPPPVHVVESTLRDVFFDFDKSDLRNDVVEQLKLNARWLKEDASRKVIIEGHCDERGTNEYNLVLGERRANSAKDYLVKFGVESGRLKTISYGEEKPFAEGHNEAAWAQNRRVHFVAE